MNLAEWLEGTLEKGLDTAMYLSRARAIIMKIEQVMEMAFSGYRKYGVRSL